jgi:Kdo2-lipid IVA lauroyltransferase/acyltransferase
LHRFLSFLLRATAKMPLRLLHAVGTVLGWAMYGMSPTYRRHLRDNLEQAGITGAATRRAAIAAAGQMLAELPAMWFRPRDAVVALVQSAEGVEAVLAARAAGKGLLLLTPHLGCFEIAAQYAALHSPITVLYRPPKMAWIEPLMRAGRERPNVRLVSADLAGVREVFKALGRGEAAGFLPDQVPGQGEGEWAPFFGRPAYTVTLAAKLAERPNIATFIAYARRLPKGAGYRIVVRPFSAKDASESATGRLNRALEALIGECPEQYLWGYNRYKVPAGAVPAP